MTDHMHDDAQAALNPPPLESIAAELGISGPHDMRSWASFHGAFRKCLAAQPPAAPVETWPRWCPGCSRNVDEVCHHFNCAIGPHGLDAQLRLSADSSPVGWLVDRPGDPTFPRFYRTKDEADAMEAFITVRPRGNVRPVFTHLPQETGMRQALEFYAREWQMNGDGDPETPGLSRTWMEPTDVLHNDEGRKARAALAVSRPQSKSEA